MKITSAILAIPMMVPTSAVAADVAGLDRLALGGLLTTLCVGANWDVEKFTTFGGGRR
jgi:hypothetical protein